MFVCLRLRRYTVHSKLSSTHLLLSRSPSFVGHQRLGGAPKTYRIPLITVALQVAELRMACRGRPFPVSLPAIGLLLSVLGLTYLNPFASNS
jgi:hypothetical protein